MQKPQHFHSRRLPHGKCCLTGSIVWGLSFSMLVSLLLVPVLYELTHRRAWKQQLAAGSA